MKNNYLFIVTTVCCMFVFKNTYAGKRQVCARSEKVVKKKFRRTFNPDTDACRLGKEITSSKISKSRAMHKNFKKQFKKSNEDIIEVTYADFLDHLSTDKTRFAINFEGSINMDIGSLSETNEVWQMPNLDEVNTQNTNITQVTPESTGIFEENEGYKDFITHAVYIQSSDVYEMYQLTDFDLFLASYYDLDESDEDEDGQTDDRIAYDVFATQSPVPLKYGESFEGIVTFVNEEPLENELDSLQYIDSYTSISQGILKTYDDGDVEAIKLIYTEEAREFVKGDTVSFTSRDEIIFYSKKGHFIRAGIDDAWSKEGDVTLTSFSYQKISGKTASTINELYSDASIFPNPVESGNQLTIATTQKISNHSVEICNLNGQKLAKVTIKETNSNQYQLKVPKELASGLYIYRLKDSSGFTVKNGKFIVK